MKASRYISKALEAAIKLWLRYDYGMTYDRNLTKSLNPYSPFFKKMYLFDGKVHFKILD